jgi:hypothetical protein
MEPHQKVLGSHPVHTPVAVAVAVAVAAAVAVAVPVAVAVAVKPILQRYVLLGVAKMCLCFG